MGEHFLMSEVPLQRQVLINAQAVGVVPLSVHTKFSVSIDGSGLRSSGDVSFGGLGVWAI